MVICHFRCSALVKHGNSGREHGSAIQARSRWNTQRDVAVPWFECDPRLTNLMQDSFPGVNILPANADHGIQPHFTSEIGIGSLPRWYRNEPREFQRHGKYLHADRGLRNRWQQRLASIGPGLKVGFSWRGGVGQQSCRRTPPIGDGNTPVVACCGIQHSTSFTNSLPTPGATRVWN